MLLNSHRYCTAKTCFEPRLQCTELFVTSSAVVKLPVNLLICKLTDNGILKSSGGRKQISEKKPNVLDPSSISNQQQAEL